jgi:hypothetical protein
VRIVARPAVAAGEARIRTADADVATAEDPLRQSRQNNLHGES